MRKISNGGCAMVRLARYALPHEGWLAMKKCRASSGLRKVPHAAQRREAKARATKIEAARSVCASSHASTEPSDAVRSSAGCSGLAVTLVCIIVEVDSNYLLRRSTPTIIQTRVTARPEQPALDRTAS